MSIPIIGRDGSTRTALLTITIAIPATMTEQDLLNSLMADLRWSLPLAKGVRHVAVKLEEDAPLPPPPGGAP